MPGYQLGMPVLAGELPRDGKLLVQINGAYSRRMAKIAAIHEIATVAVEFPETQPVDPQRTAPSPTWASSIARLLPSSALGRVFIVDAMGRLAVGQAIVFRGLPSSRTVRRRQATIVCATPGTGTVQLINSRTLR